MLSKKFLNKRRILWPLAVLFALMFAWMGNQWYQNKLRTAYFEVLDNSSLATTFALSDTVAKVATDNNLYYQKFKNGQLIESNNTSIPTPKLVTMVSTAGAQTIIPPWQHSMASIIPSAVTVSWHTYVVLPFFTHNDGDGYLVYKRVSLLP